MYNNNMSFLLVRVLHHNTFYQLYEIVFKYYFDYDTVIRKDNIYNIQFIIILYILHDDTYRGMIY